MRIGILTGGGDVPGLNPCIKAVAMRGMEQGNEVIGIRRGWGGLLWMNRDDPATIDEYTVGLDFPTVRKIDRTGGTMLHTSRINPGRVAPDDVPDFLKGTVDMTEEGPFDFTPPCDRESETPGHRHAHSHRGRRYSELRGAPAP